MGRRRRPAKKARQTLSTTQSTPDIIMLGADSPSPKRRRVRSQRQPDLIPEPDVICLSDDEDRFANDSFSNLGGRWFNNDITITLSDEEEYQRMADEVAAQSASSSDDNARWPSSSSNSSDGDAPELNISSEGQSVGKESRSGMGITGKFSFFSRFEGYMARIPPNCVRPQRGGHEREFPFKGRKRGTTLFRKICVAKERNGHKRAYGHGAHRPYNTQRGRMKSSTAILLAAVVVGCAIASTERLQIGIKKRAESCDVKSRKGDTLHMHYTGTLLDGTEFDSSRKRDQPFTFVLGAGQVIKGWDQGLLNMCVGEQRRLTIPASLGYGEHGAPPTIPGGATLKFDVELMKIDRKGGEL